MIKNSIPSISEIDRTLKDAYDLRVSDIKTSIDLTLDSKVKCQSIDYKKGEAVSNNYLGLFYMIIGKNTESLTCSELALGYFQQTDDKENIASAYYNIGSVHYKSSNLSLGLDFLYKCLSINQELEDKFSESRTLKAIGYIYDVYGQYDKAIETYIHCRKISEEIGDLNGVSNACNPLSGLYLKNGDFANALECADTSLKFKKETGDKRGYTFSLYAKAKVHSTLGEYRLALNLFLECLEIQNTVGEPIGISMCLVKLGKVHYLLEDFNSAKKYLFEAIEFSGDHSLIQYVSKAYYYLFRVAKAQYDDSLALKYHIAYHKNRKIVIERDTSDKLKGMEAVWRAETLEREANIQRLKNEEISKKNAELDKFVYRVSHDLRGPISSLIGLYNIVKKEITDKDSIYYFDLYNRQINRLNSIIVGLIELTKVKDWQIQKDEIEFHAIVDDCLSSFNYLPNFDKITFNINIEKELNFYSDKSLINTIMQNLIENGIKYSNSDNPFLDIEIKKSKSEHLSIEVSDNGIGIDVLYQEKIFDMFFRASEEVSGTGLGMYILKNAVEKLNGSIKLKSELGKGSSFKIEIEAS